MRYLSTTTFVLTAVPWAMFAAGLASQSTVLFLSAATGLLVSAAWRSQAPGQFEPSMARVLYEAEHEAES